MSELLTQYADSSFIDAIVALAPGVGAGMILGFIIAIIGWLWGFVIRLGRFEP